jgi:hypothetical protein
VLRPPRLTTTGRATLRLDVNAMQAGLLLELGGCRGTFNRAWWSYPSPLPLPRSEHSLSLLTVNTPKFTARFKIHQLRVRILGFVTNVPQGPTRVL